MNNLAKKAMIDLGISLTELTIKGTVDVIQKKIKAMKDVKDAEKLRETYDALINEVLQEREDALRIAQLYQAELDKIIISDEDLEQLHSMFSHFIDIYKAINFTNTNKKIELETELIREIISLDNLKTIQIIGFKYKEAIGEPLTRLCATLISNCISKNNKK